MHIIAGLRNAKEQYKNTRHNVGEIVVEHFVAEYGLPNFVSSAAYSAQISEGVIAGEEVSAILPNTFMNESGSSLKKIMQEGSDSAQLIVVHDDLDLPIGSFKITNAGGSGGHNGVQSVIDALGTNDFVRVRIGISPLTIFGSMKRPRGDRLSKFVLQDFSRREHVKLDALMPEVVSTLHTILTKGVAAAMNTYN